MKKRLPGLSFRGLSSVDDLRKPPHQVPVLGQCGPGYHWNDDSHKNYETNSPNRTFIHPKT